MLFVLVNFHLGALSRLTVVNYFCENFTRSTGFWIRLWIRSIILKKLSFWPTAIFQQLYCQITKTVKFLLVTLASKFKTYFLGIPISKQSNIKKMRFFFISHAWFFAWSQMLHISYAWFRTSGLVIQDGQIFDCNQYYMELYSVHHSCQWKTCKIHKEKDFLHKLLHWFWPVVFGPACRSFI